MHYILILLALTSNFSYAGIKKLHIEGLNFDYKAPEGTGTVKKINLGFSLAPAEYGVKVVKTSDSFELTSDFIDVSWQNPWPFLYELEMGQVKNTTIKVGNNNHSLTSDEFVLRPDDRGDYKAQKVTASCLGTGTGELDKMLLEDCRTKMDASIKRVDVPVDFILYKVLPELPAPSSEIDLPADDFKFTSRNGNFNLAFYVKYYFYAGLRTHGHFHYENDYKTIVIRVDQIRFGYLSVTNLVMKRLKEIVKSPNIKIEPPFIRINLGNQ